MRAPHFVTEMLSVGLMLMGVGMVSGQNFPNKPIRIVASEIGGGSDFAARLIAPALSERLGQQVVVDSRVTQIAIETVAKAPPDGYTLLFVGSALWVLPFLQKTVYDPVRDFSPISLAASSASILVVHPSLPVKSAKELIALAKARPGELNFASGATGSSTYLARELFKSMAGINIVGITYKSTGSALIDLLSGDLQSAFSSPGPVASHIKSGRLKALAVTSTQPSALAPGLPTVAASGLPGYESVSRQALFSPAETPAAIISRLNREIAQVLNLTDVKVKFLTSGVEAVSSTPEQLGAMMKSEIARLGKVIKDAGIKAD